MRLQLSPDSRVFIDLRATGWLRAVGHDPTLTAIPEPASIDVEARDGGAVDTPIELRFRADRVEPPESLERADRDRMRAAVRGVDVLDAERFPIVALRGRYAGSRSAGRIEGDLTVRGTVKRIEMDVRVAASGDASHVTGTWVGRLTDLGIKPFRALMGTLRLDDWIRLRVEARWVPRLE